MSHRINTIRMLYKRETSEEPLDEEFYLHFYRSKGKWVLDEDSSNIRINGNNNHFEAEWIEVNPDYVEWLENKVLELMDNSK